jgi:hypothetical protein
MRARLNSKLHRFTELIESKAESATLPTKKMKQTRSDVDQKPKKMKAAATRNHSKAVEKKQRAEKKIQNTASEALRNSSNMRKTEPTSAQKVKRMAS